MTGLIVLLFSHGVAPVADHARLEIAFARARDFAASVEPVSLYDPALRRAAKVRCFMLFEYLEKCRALMRKKDVDGQIYFNMIQISQDVAQGYADAVNMPAASLAACRWGQEMSEAVYACLLRKYPGGGNANQGNAKVEIELIRGNVERALAAYLRSVHGELRVSITVVQTPLPKPKPPLPPPPQPFALPPPPFALPAPPGLWIPPAPESPQPLIRRDYTH